MGSKQNQSDDKIDFLPLRFWCMWTKWVTVPSAELFILTSVKATELRREEWMEKDGWGVGGGGRQEMEVTKKKF